MSDEAEDAAGAKPSLEYFLSEKKPFLVLSFIGQMTKEAIPILDACIEELKMHDTSFHVISFHDVDAVEAPAIASIVRIQKELRDRGALRVCFLKPEVKKILREKGAVRDLELSNNLTEALTALRAAVK